MIDIKSIWPSINKLYLPYHASFCFFFSSSCWRAIDSLMIYMLYSQTNNWCPLGEQPIVRKWISSSSLCYYFRTTYFLNLFPSSQLKPFWTCGTTQYIEMRAVVIFCCICESAGEGIPKDMTCHPIWTKPYSSTLMGSKLRHQFKNNNRVSRLISVKIKFIILTNAWSLTRFSLYAHICWRNMSLPKFH